MTAQSLLPLLASGKEGVVDPSRSFAVFGRERHVAHSRPGNVPYPSRAIRTRDFLYIRNFRPERWPMGVAPGFGLPEGPMPGSEALENETYAAFADFDASPTKAFLVSNYADPQIARYFALAFGKRPEEELYDLRKDRWQVTNVASDEFYSAELDRLREHLLSILRETSDPRVTNDGKLFEEPPFAGAE